MNIIQIPRGGSLQGASGIPLRITIDHHGLKCFIAYSSSSTPKTKSVIQWGRAEEKKNLTSDTENQLFLLILLLRGTLRR